MKRKVLVLALALAALVVVSSASFALAHRGYEGYYSESAIEAEDDWWQEMRSYMEQRWQGELDDEQWQEMRQHMEERWGEVEEECWQERREYMEERWEELEEGSYGFGGYGRRGGFGGCHW